MLKRTVLRIGLILTVLILPCVRGACQQCINAHLKIEVNAPSGGGLISLGIANESEELLKIFDTTNGWGANRHRVLVIRKEQIYGFFEESQDAYFYTHPSFSEIAPRSRLMKSLDLNDGNWSGRRGRRFTLRPGDRVVVVYDVPPTKVAEKYGVWCGTAAGVAVVR